MKRALRRLARSPGFSMTIILMIALGAGVNASMFSLVESILVRPLPYPEPDRLVRVRGTVPGRGVVPWVSPPDLADMQTLTRVFEHIRSIVVSSIALLALLLSMVGLYGTIAHLVSERRSEIAVRVAMGATAGRVIRVVLSRGGWIVGGGMVAGLGLLAVTSRFLGSWLFGLSALDPWTLATTLALLVLGALAACVVPVHRALIVDPVEELRAS